MNKFDQLFDTVINESLKANSKADFLSDEKALRYFQYVLTGLLEVKWIKEAFINEYIPRANKLYLEYRMEWHKSKYKDTVDLNDNLLKETIHETVRLGYVGLFHKYESFINGLVEEVDLFFKELWNTPLEFEKYINQEFQIKITNNWKLSKTIERINWICNSCKHYNGKPKIPKHPLYIEYPEDQKMVFSKMEYKTDCEAVEKYCELMIKFVNTLASYRLVNEKNPNDSFSIDPTEEMIVLKEKLATQIKILIEAIKSV